MAAAGATLKASVTENMRFAAQQSTKTAQPDLTTIFTQQTQQQNTTISSPTLPEGWEMKTTPEGKNYYVNHKTKTTHWEPPV